MSEPRSGSRPGDAAPVPTPPTEIQPAADDAESHGPSTGAGSDSAGPPSDQARPTEPETAGAGARPDHGTPPAYGTPPAPGTPPAYPAPPVYGSPAGPVPMNPPEERNWAMAAHLSSFVAAYVALGFLGPLLVMLTAGGRSPFVRRHAVEALNFNLSVLIYVIACVPLSLILIGIPMLLALAILYLVTTVQGAIAASRGQEYRYPLTIRLVS
ncbi:MAG TPA: DUF4870 domain-containing protein [Kineosporiaceae bacterium]|nr:DUF4870 domain-containing protein [Kineosporiaceae bacterium]